MFDIVIVEDEPVIADRVERLTTEILKNKMNKTVRIKRFEDVDTAVDYLAEHPIDLLLLDLKLTGRSGFDVLKHTAAEAYQTIVISAYAEKAITAFEWGCLDFVNKPFSQQRLEKALTRFLDAESRAAVGVKFLSIKGSQGLEMLDVQDVIYLQGADNYSEVILRSGTRRLHDKNLTQLQMVLSNEFLRVHKSYVVRIDEMKQLLTYRGGRYEIELTDGTMIPVGRTRLQSVQSVFA